MAKILLFLISLIALISLIFNAKFVLQKQNTNFKVTEVIDGDTFKIDYKDGQRVRLLGIDAPETGKCLSPESKSKLEQLNSPIPTAGSDSKSQAGRIKKSRNFGDSI